MQNFYKFVQWTNNLSESQRKIIEKDCYYFYSTVIIILLVLMVIFIVLESIETFLRKIQRKDFLDVRESKYLSSPMSEKANILSCYIRHYKRLNMIYDLEVLSRILSIIILLFVFLLGILGIVPIIGSLFKKNVFFKLIILCMAGIVYIFYFLLYKGILYKAGYEKDVSHINKKIEINVRFINKMKSEFKKMKSELKK